MFSYGFSYGFLWFSYGFLWFSYGFPRVFPWFSHVFPCFSHEFNSTGTPPKRSAKAHISEPPRRPGHSLCGRRSDMGIHRDSNYSKYGYISGYIYIYYIIYIYIILYYILYIIYYIILNTIINMWEKKKKKKHGKMEDIMGFLWETVLPKNIMLG